MKNETKGHTFLALTVLCVFGIGVATHFNAEYLVPGFIIGGAFCFMLGLAYSFPKDLK